MDELTDAQVSRPEMDDAQVSAAPQPDYTNPVNQAVFNQGAGAKILNATFGGVLRPYLAADTAIKEAMSSGFSDGAIQDLKNAGSLLDVQQKQSDVEHAVVGGIMMPTAAVAAAPQVALDYALRAANAGINAPIAAIGAALMPGKSPKEIAEQTPEALNQAFFALQGSPIGQMIEDVRLASSVTEAGIPVVRENAPAPTIQEMMAAPVKTEEGKAVEATAPIIPKAPVKNPLIEEGTGNLNLDYIKGDSDMLAAHGRAAQAIADRDGVVVSNTLTRENSQEMIETAMRENADGIPDALRDREFDAPTNAAEVDAARQIADGEMRRFWALKDIYSQTGDERDYNAASEAYDSLMNATGIRHNISATPGRALQAHQMVLGEDTAVNEALANKLVGMSKEEGMRVTMELPNQQAVAKFALGLKKTAWQSAREIPMFLWYNWLLSGYVSHLTYLGMGMYQAVARTIPESLLDAGVGAVQRKLGYGLSIAEYKALTAERDALKATLEKGGLKAAEGGKAEARIKEIETRLEKETTSMPAKIRGQFIGAGQGTVDGIRAMGRAYKTGNVQVFPHEEKLAQQARMDAASAALKDGKSAEEARKAGEAAYMRAIPHRNNPIIDLAGFMKEDSYARKLTERLGTVLGLFERNAMAIHTLQRFSGYGESLYSQAYNMAAHEGLEGEALARRAAWLKDHPTDKMVAKASEDGKHASFVNKPGKVGKAIEDFSHASAWTNFIVPFARISMSKTAQIMLEHTPVGLANDVNRAKLLGESGLQEQSRAIARQIIGAPFISAGAWLASKGVVNGMLPSDPNERARFYRDGNAMWSIRIGGHNIPLRYLSIPGGVLGLGVAAFQGYNAYADKEKWDQAERIMKVVPGGFDAAMEKGMQAVGQSVLEDNPLLGLANLLNMVEGGDQRESDNYAINTLASMAVPVGISQTTHNPFFSVDPYMRSTLGKDFSDTLQKTIDSRLPWKSQDLYPRVDIFGKDMLKNEDHQAALEDPVYQTMSRLNLSPSHVEPQIDKVKLTDAQFYDYSKKAGGIYRSNVESIINIPGFANLPVKTQVELIYRQQAKSREQAKRYMVIRYPELAKRNAEINRGIVGMTDE